MVKITAAQQIDTDIGPVSRRAYNPNTGTHEACVPVEKFIKGPIPLEWITRANGLPGKAGAVGLALWFLAGVQKTRTIKLTAEIERIAACNRKSVYQALNSLEDSRLVGVKRRPGARPIVTIQAPHCNNMFLSTPDAHSGQCQVLSIPSYPSKT